ncbi:MAG: hypothetical protein K6E54_11180 [Bacteroidaceae bacterium]|jgi:hypothetical protein|nr:hypothetical protein [Bacteroidaceae bacterium]
MKKMYIIPETKVSEFKAQMMCLSIHDDEIADGSGTLAPERNGNEENWGNLWQ